MDDEEAGDIDTYVKDPELEDAEDDDGQVWHKPLLVKKDWLSDADADGFPRLVRREGRRPGVAGGGFKL